MIDGKNYTGLSADELKEAAIMYCNWLEIDPNENVRYDSGTLAITYRPRWMSVMEELNYHYEKRHYAGIIEGIVNGIVRMRKEKK